MMSREHPLIQLSAYEDVAAMSDRLERSVGRNAADKTTERILSAIDLLDKTPYMGPLHQDEMLARLGCRRLVVGRYVVAYRIYDGQPTVLRVFYGPGDCVDGMDV